MYFLVERDLNIRQNSFLLPERSLIRLYRRMDRSSAAYTPQTMSNSAFGLHEGWHRYDR